METEDQHKELDGGQAHWSGWLPKLIGVDGSLGYILWPRYFMQEQGYDMDASLLYQDNMSVILLETNGKVSSTKQTKHIKVGQDNLRN